MPKYDTRQRRALTDYLCRHHDESMTAKAIAAALREQGISQSAVYRNLAALEAEGKVRRVTAAGAHESLYQFADADECRNSLHLSCTKCGRTFHMALPDAALLESSLAQNEGFAIDKASTILYGTCGDCQKQ